MGHKERFKDYKKYFFKFFKLIRRSRGISSASRACLFCFRFKDFSTITAILIFVLVSSLGVFFFLIGAFRCRYRKLRFSVYSFPNFLSPSWFFLCLSSVSIDLRSCLSSTFFLSSSHMFNDGCFFSGACARWLLSSRWRTFVSCIMTLESRPLFL